MRIKLSIILTVLCLSRLSVQAATIYTAASPSYTDVNAKVILASDGDTVQIPAGTATWTSGITIAKGITVQGAGRTSTVITNNISGTGSYSQPLFTLSDGGSGTRRISAIGMRAPAISNNFTGRQGIGIAIYGYGTQKRVDNCQFDDLYAGLYIGNSNGVSDHNYYYNLSEVARHVGYNLSPDSGVVGQLYAWNHFRPLAFDSLNYFIHENETVEITGDANVSDEVEACSYCFRYSTITLREAHSPYTAAQSFPLFDCHGDNPLSGQYSALATLIYENDITLKTGAQSAPFMTHRGGKGIYFNNRVVSQGGSGYAAVQIWEESVRYNYPHWTYWDVAQDVYVWNNTYNGAVQGAGPDQYSGSVIIEGVNYFNHPPQSGQYGYPLALPTYPHPLVSGGVAPTPTPTATPQPTPTPGPLGMIFPSSAGVITAPFVVNSDNTISQAIQTVDPTLGGQAVYTFGITNPGNYIVTANVDCPSDASNSFFVNIDSQPTVNMVWSIPLTSGLEPRTVSWGADPTPHGWTLTAGTHQLIIRGREAGAKLGQITIAAAVPPPQNLRIVGP
jgi:hypothetical protein